METITVSKKQDVPISTRIKSKPSWTIYNKRIKIVDKSNKTVAIFLKNEIKDQFLLDAGRDLERYAMVSTLRTQSAGIKKVTTLNDKTFKVANPVMSSIVGYAGPSNFHPCRKTVLYNKHAKHFDTITVKLLQKLSKLFKQYAPKQYAIQKKFVNSINQHMLLKDTVYTTATVNKDFRTLSHRDKGDYDSGLGNLMVFDYTKGYCRKHINDNGYPKHKFNECPNNKNKKSFSGGEFLLPEFKIGFNMQEGDVLFVDVHSIHCNNPISGKGRVSLVCYARTDIQDRCKGLSKTQLENFTSF